MPSTGAIHEVIAAWALFVGAFQFILRWKWAGNFRIVDAIAMRLWATSTMITAFTIAATMYYFRDAVVNGWFLLVVLVVVAKTIATIWAVVALRSWMSDVAGGRHHRGPL